MAGDVQGHTEVMNVQGIGAKGVEVLEQEGVMGKDSSMGKQAAGFDFLDGGQGRPVGEHGDMQDAAHCDAQHAFVGLVSGSRADGGLDASDVIVHPHHNIFPTVAVPDFGKLLIGSPTEVGHQGGGKVDAAGSLQYTPGLSAKEA